MSDADPELPPAGIRLIREARRETRTELADHLDVSPKTIGNWERGDQPPSEENREGLLNLIPADLTMDDVLEAADRFDDQQQTHDDERRLFGSKWLQAVRDQPRIADEIGDGAGISVFTDKQRMFIERLDLTGVKGDVQRDGKRVTTVYYLIGDERRAIRRFIDENEPIVREQLQGAPNRISGEWDEWMYELLEQEYRFSLYE